MLSIIKKLLNVVLTDKNGKFLELESNGAVPVNIQDQHTEIIDLYMIRETGTTTPTAGISIDARNITVNSTTGAVQFDAIEIIENGRAFQAIIQSIVGNVITFNAPSDQNFTTDAVVRFGEWNMNYNGSSTTLIYSVKPPAGVARDINRIIIGMLDDAPMDDGKFGGITALTNGIVLRIKNGQTKNIFILSDNGGFRERSFDVSYIDKAPSGQYGFGCRKTFNGQDKSGVAIRLSGDDGDELEMLIQDDLTGLLKMAIVCQGHVVLDN